jgi:hypothetical protein
MGFFNWFSAKPAPPSTASSQTDIHATLADATRPFLPANGKLGLKPPVQTALGASTQRVEQRRTERNARRELLFQVVRESMVRVGVLSSAFKFKVLALDQRGRTFLVMIDLSSEFAGETDKLAEIEALIAQTAKTRYELVVQAVYWRFYDTVASGSVAPRAVTSGVPTAMMGTSASVRPPVAQYVPPPKMQAVPAAPIRAPIPPQPAANQADPIDLDEVAAFKRALASGAQPGMAIPMGGSTAAAKPLPATFAKPVAAAVPKAGAALPVPSTGPAPVLGAAAAARAASLAAINNKLLLTGYEDTEMHDSDEPAPALSSTQYGELR